MLYKKPTECQNYLRAKSAHALSLSLSLKKNIPYSQALRIKCDRSSFGEYKKHSNGFVKRFLAKE